MPKSTIPFQLCAALAFFVALLHSAVANDPSHPLAAHWEYLATSKDNQPVTFKLRLAGEHFDELSSKMLHIATTRSSWLNSEQLQHYVTPSRQDQTAVQEFLDKHGVASDQVHVNRFKNAWTIKSDAALVSKVSKQLQYALISSSQSLCLSRRCSIPLLKCTDTKTQV